MALEYGVIVGRYRSTIASPPDDDDDIPDLEPLVGTIILDPRPEVILVDDTAAEGAMTITPMPTRVELNADGDLTHNGRPYVKLLSPESSSIDTHDWTYEVSFDLRTLDGQPVRMNSYDIFVKASHTVELPLDLTKATPVIRNTGTQTIIGPSNVLSIGTVITGAEAQAIITGTSPAQVLDLVLPQGEQGEQGEKGDRGPANKLSIGTVTKALEPKATITGDAPEQTLSLELPEGAQGPIGPTPNISIGTVTTLPNPSDDNWLAPIIKGGPLTQQAMRDAFPTTMQGAKGDIGIGWSPGTLYNTSADTVLTAGTYRITGTASTALSYPVATAGTLVVESRIAPAEQYGPSVVQTFTPFFGSPEREGRVSYRRVLTGGNWQPWRAYSAQRVDNTAGRVVYTWDDTNNREQMVYGDTGLRDISSLMTGVTIPENVWPSLRRVGATVTVTFNGVSPAVAAATGSYLEMLHLPQGFRAPQTLNMYASVNTSNTPIKSFQVTNGYMVRLYQNPAPTDQIRERVIFDTNDPWPTTLPGTAR